MKKRHIMIISIVGILLFLRFTFGINTYQKQYPKEIELSDNSIDTSDQIVISDSHSDADQNLTIETEAETTYPSDEPIIQTVTPEFYYTEIPDHIKEKITGISFPEKEGLISYDDLAYVVVEHYDLNGDLHQGELICNQAIAQDLVDIFRELYNNHYPIEKIRLVDEYNGDDDLSMLDNNTSCFNYRTVAGTDRLSNHAYGMAIDINPFYNPYVVLTDQTEIERVSPVESSAYADRTTEFPYKIDENDLAYKLFSEHGFIWGGHWKTVKDYQHFEKK